MENFNDYDIVIALKSKNGIMIGPASKIYVKDNSELRQIGLIQELNLKMTADKLVPELTISFPEEIPGMSDGVKKSLSDNISLLKNKGCNIEQTA